jgi:DNA-binding CsgD family transcriptional regulator
MVSTIAKGTFDVYPALDNSVLTSHIAVSQSKIMLDLESLPWTRINDFILDVGSARTEEELDRKTASGVGALIPFDVGAATFRFERNTVRYAKATDGLENTGRLLNTYYRFRFPIPVDYLRQHEGTDFTPWEDTEYVTDFIRPAGIWSALGIFDLQFQFSIFRSRSAPVFSDRERAIARILQPHLNNIHRRLRKMDGLFRTTVKTVALEAAGGLLTRREAEILKCLALRMTAREIGAALCMSHRTAERHIQNMYEKLGVRCRADLLLKFYGSFD